MKLLKKLACAAAIAMSMGAVHAQPVLNGWHFSPNGTGFAGSQRINESLDVNGNAFIDITATGGSSFSFTEHAVFNIVQADSNGRLFPQNYPGGNITATFEATGTGNFNGSFTFTDGTIRMYQNPTNGQYASSAGFYGANLGNQIAVFDVMQGGGGMVDAGGSPTANGQVTVFARAEAGALDSGYFFRENGQDLSLESILGFAFTNANPTMNPTGLQVQEIICQYAEFTGPGCGTGTYANSPGNHLFIGGNGQFKLGEVPEPGSLALFGIAMLGAGMVTRKRSMKA